MLGLRGALGGRPRAGGTHDPVLEAAMTLSAEAVIRVPIRDVDVIPTGAALAAEVRGVDLRHLDDAAFAQVMDAWHQHSVLLFRGQSLSDQELIAFSRRL